MHQKCTRALGTSFAPFWASFGPPRLETNNQLPVRQQPNHNSEGTMLGCNLHVWDSTVRNDPKGWPPLCSHVCEPSTLRGSKMDPNQLKIIFSKASPGPLGCSTGHIFDQTRTPQPLPPPLPPARPCGEWMGAPGR